MLPPKIASRSLLTLASYYSPSRGIIILSNGHRHLSEIDSLLPIDKSKCIIYSFYRNPLDRFISLYKYCVLMNENNYAIYRDLSVSSFIELLYDYIHNYVSYPMLDLGTPQTCFMDDTTILLDVINIDTEIQKVQKAWNVPSVPLCSINKSVEAKVNLSKENINNIKQLYASDYAFFKSRDIYF